MRTIEELRVQNNALEKSYEYQRIIPEVMKGLYTQFVNEQIEQLRSMVEDNRHGRFQNKKGLHFLSMKLKS